MKKVFFIVKCLLLFLIACKTQQPEVVRPKPTPPVVQTGPKAAPVEKPRLVPKLQKEFSIALLLPLYLQQNMELDTSDINPELDLRSLSALSFYEGALLAADSLTKSGIKVKINVYDISEDTSAKHFMLLNYRTLKNSDLIFASYPSTHISEAVDAAKSYGLNIVFTQFGNPLLLKDNPNIVFASPSTTTQCKLMTEFIVNNFSDANYIVDALDKINATLSSTPHHSVNRS